MTVATLTAARPREAHREVFLLCVAPAVTILLASIHAILTATGGVFVYSLDDPYIHLAVSDQIRAGHYGLNAGEYASPCSSILYPFLLAPFSNTSLHLYVPLFLNAAATGVSLWAASGIVAKSAALEGTPARVAAAALVLIIAIACNVFGVVFTGLEHSLHIAASVLVTYGLILVAGGQGLPTWLVPAIIALPLLRYEGAALALASCAALAILGLRRQALIAGLGALIGLGGFSLFLVNLGLPALPSSILAKSEIVRDGVATGLGGLLAAKIGNLLRDGRALNFALLALAMGLLAGQCWGRGTLCSRPLVVVAAMIAALGAHVLGGAHGWLDRYEVYVIFTASCVLAWLVLLAARGATGIGAWVMPIALTALAVFFSYKCGYWRTTLKTAMAARNVFDQHYQMARFVQDIVKAPVAVNDIGRVKWGNPHHVLDLWGLGSEEARKLRLAHASGEAAAACDPGWLDSLVGRRSIGVVIIYPKWYPCLPSNWKRAATLKADAPLVSVGSNNLAVYATPAADLGTLNRHLEQWSALLPEGVRLEPER